ncbi:hypothetical protein BX661DRAFT_188391 [Kickxella alabastrina]|uniref:uncharacterized protein n=1 Tax=Kickxella alabastrina TaxID=61397 RepID=UPI00221FCFC6|nr:uncharacterized protein BX661DRAFT_188391 [Kickxella alabastrina]KAI7821479.1 hypothetical protein BX661DRAFT_188391 [Kickxella alabastrina]
MFDGPRPSQYIAKPDCDSANYTTTESGSVHYRDATLTQRTDNGIPRSGNVGGGGGGSGSSKPQQLSGFPSTNISGNHSYVSSGPQPYPTNNQHMPMVAAGPVRFPVPPPLPLQSGVAPAMGNTLYGPGAGQYSSGIDSSVYPENMSMAQQQQANSAQQHQNAYGNMSAGVPPAQQQQKLQEMQQVLPGQQTQQTQQQMAPPPMAYSMSAPRAGQEQVEQLGGQAYNFHSGMSDATSVYNVNAHKNNISGTPPGINNMSQILQSATPNPQYYGRPTSVGPEFAAQLNNSNYQQQQRYTTVGSVIGNPATAGGFNAPTYLSSPTMYNQQSRTQPPPPASMVGGPISYQQHHQQQQYPPYVPSMIGDDNSGGSRMNKAGKYALGALAAGAVAYGVHEFMDGGLSEDDKKPNRKRMEEKEKVRREQEARMRREDEERKRREDHEKWRRNEEEKRRQDLVFQSQQFPSQHQPQTFQSQQFHSQQYHNQPPESITSSSHSHMDDSIFHPPAPFGHAPYTYNQKDVRNPDPSRSSENSATPETYPELRQNPSDTKIKIGTVLSLKHILTGRFLHSDRSHSTQSGSNQQLVYANKWTTGEADWWQVVPANGDVPVPGSIVAYGTQIRLRHVDTGRHLHSHYGFVDPLTGQNEVTCFGDQTLSDENDHWVLERWGDGAYGSTVSPRIPCGMTLHSHDVLLHEDVQSVTCFGSGRDDNNKWRIVLESL